MDFGAINNGCVLVGGKLTLLGVGLITLQAEVGDVFFHDRATCLMGVVSLEIDASVQIALPVFSDVIVLFKGILKVMGMAVADIFITKVIDGESEEDRAPFVAPKTGGGYSLVVSMLVYAFFKEIFSKDA